MTDEAQRAARELQTALTLLQSACHDGRRLPHSHTVEADLYEVGLILEHLAELSADWSLLR